MSPALSIIIPTRDRASYLPHALRTCTDNPSNDFEILVLNNASTDETDEVMQRVNDPRIRYVRNDKRLSMRDNFEKGIEESRGRIVGFIGDDDGVFPFTVEAVLDLFDRHQVGAVSAARAHYFWPDLRSPRKGSGLVPRGSGIDIVDSRTALRRVLTDNDYYRLPCLYHGFVSRSIVDRIRTRQGRFFLSSQVDMFSSIALSMEGIAHAFSHAPLVINGASSRSNGASHFGGGTSVEKTLWKQEDDLGFLPGFDNAVTVGALIVESAIRYGRANGSIDVAQMLDPVDVLNALQSERHARSRAGRSESESRTLYETAGIPWPMQADPDSGAATRRARLARLARSFKAARPLNLEAIGITDVYRAAQHMSALIDARQTGLFSQPIGQLMTALKLAGR